MTTAATTTEVNHNHATLFTVTVTLLRSLRSSYTTCTDPQVTIFSHVHIYMVIVYECHQVSNRSASHRMQYSIMQMYAKLCAYK